MLTATLQGLLRKLNAIRLVSQTAQQKLQPAQKSPSEPAQPPVSNSVQPANSSSANLGKEMTDASATSGQPESSTDASKDAKPDAVEQIPANPSGTVGSWAEDLSITYKNQITLAVYSQQILKSLVDDIPKTVRLCLVSDVSKS